MIIEEEPTSLLIKEGSVDFPRPYIPQYADGIPSQVLENSQTNDRILKNSAIEIERKFKQLDEDWHARRKHPHKNLLIQQE